MGAGYYIGTGICNAFKKLGHEVLISTSDIDRMLFEEFQPDLFFGSISYMNDFDVDYLNDTNIKVLAWTFPHTPIDTTKDLLMTSVTPEQESKLLKLKNLSGVVIQFLQPNAEEYCSNWIKKGVKVIGMPCAADILTYYPKEPTEKYKSDLAYIGGYWPKKAGTHLNAKGLDHYIVPLKKKYGQRFKIYGWGWPKGLCEGTIPFGSDNDLFNSAKIILNLHEPHSRNLGIDVTERVFKVMASKGFQIVDYVEALRGFFKEDELVAADTLEGYHKLVEHYLKHPEDRAPFIEKGYKRVMKEHCYTHRVEELLKKI